MLTGWKYRKSHIITNNVASTLTNYQVSITVNRSTGTDSGSSVYIGTKCLSTYADIRFTDGSDNLLDYWIETSDSSSAKIWVEVGSIPASSTAQIFMYYGNDSASAVSSAANTFLFFDDFSSGLGASWTTTGSIAGSVSDGILTVSKSGSSSGGTFYDNTGTHLYKSLLMNVKFALSPAGDYIFSMFGFVASYSGGVWPTNALGVGTTTEYIAVSSASSSGSSSSYTGDQTAYHNCEIRWQSGEMKLYVDDTLQVTKTTNIPSTAMYPGAWVQSNGASILVNWLAVKNCCATEPTHTSWGSEEPASCGMGFCMGSDNPLLV